MHMVIIEVMIEGAGLTHDPPELQVSFVISSQLVSHLTMIIRSMKPKRASMHRSMGRNSKRKSIGFLKYQAFEPRQQMPRHMWKTPRMTDSFILNEFKKVNSSADMYQAGSTPNG